MISVEHLTKRYGAQLAVSDVTFSCSPGTVTGFLGPNGQVAPMVAGWIRIERSEIA